jgi:thioredoxin reductase (NADPH)
LAVLKHFPLLIIGGGPIGLACGLEAAKQHIDYLIVEKGTLVNSLYNYPVNMTFFSTSERLEIGRVPFVTNSPKPKRAEALEYYRRVAQDSRISINLFEEVIDIKPSHVDTMIEARNKGQQIIGEERPALLFTITTNKATYTANNIIVATGFYDIPYFLNIPGENLPKVKHYYDDPHFYAFQKVVIVGAQNSAVDAALETWRKGADVTMIVRGSEIGQRVKYWVKPDIENRIKEGSIKAHFNSYVKEIREAEVIVATPGGEIQLENNWVLSLTGYQPNLSFLEKINVQLGNDATRKPVYDEDTHQTNIAGIYLAGVICGGMNTHRLFIENSREHAEKIITHIKSKA